MIPVKLSIRGFLSYQEQEELDFTGIHVACISGRNGAGKSALLDAITWALFGEARKSDDSIINDNAPDNTAKVDFEFLYEDTNYLVRRQKTRGKPVTVDFFIRAADGINWKALSEKKVTDTNKRIRDTLRMDYKTFINASFFLQGKADQFTGQNAAERKKILSTILNLEIWEAYKAKASEKRKLAENNAQYIKGLIDEAEDELKQEAVLIDTLKAAQVKAAEAEKAYKDADEKWQLAKTNEASLKILQENTVRKQQEEARQVRSIRDQKAVLETREQELNKLRAEIANADQIAKKYADLLNARELANRLTADAAEYSSLTEKQVMLASKIQNTEQKYRYDLAQLTKEKKESDRLLPEKQRLSEICAADTERIRVLSDGCAALPDLRRELETIKSRGAEMGQIVKNLDEKIQELKGKLENILSNRGGVCPTCGQVMDAEHCRIHSQELQGQIGDLQNRKAGTEAAIVDEREHYRITDRRIKQLEAAEKELQSLRQNLSANQQKLRMIGERLSGAEERDARIAGLETTLNNGDFCPEEREEILSIRKRIAELNYDPKEYERLRREMAELAGAEQEHQKLIAARSRIEPLEREIRDKNEQLCEAEEHLKTLQEERKQAENSYHDLKDRMPDLVQIENERSRVNQLRDRCSKELGQAEQRVRHLEDARAVLEARGREYQDKLQEIRRFKDLEKAFGKDGIPALLIEQAVPEIQEQANEVLQQLSNGTMSLQLNTQGAYKSRKDEVKETLDILIQDAYGVREYEMFSGGEAFRINFSIRLALSRLLSQRAGSRMQILVIDEGFGSQDEEGRARLTEAITTVQDDFEKILVITHLPELKEAFPARIEVEKTFNGSHIEVIL
ncbi:MAG: SMC family ATPase [Anaerolineaceae bacterium]|nr:SMC family ATPase [Anaerolineaceae bacterium]